MNDFPEHFGNALKAWRLGVTSVGERRTPNKRSIAIPVRDAVTAQVVDNAAPQTVLEAAPAPIQGAAPDTRVPGFDEDAFAWNDVVTNVPDFGVVPDGGDAADWVEQLKKLPELDDALAAKNALQDTTPGSGFIPRSRRVPPSDDIATEPDLERRLLIPGVDFSSAEVDSLKAQIFNTPHPLSAENAGPEHVWPTPEIPEELSVEDAVESIVNAPAVVVAPVVVTPPPVVVVPAPSAAAPTPPAVTPAPTPGPVVPAPGPVVTPPPPVLPIDAAVAATVEAIRNADAAQGLQLVLDGLNKTGDELKTHVEALRFISNEHVANPIDDVSNVVYMALHPEVARLTQVPATLVGPLDPFRSLDPAAQKVLDQASEAAALAWVAYEKEGADSVIGRDLSIEARRLAESVPGGVSILGWDSPESAAAAQITRTLLDNKLLTGNELPSAHIGDLTARLNALGMNNEGVADYAVKFFHGEKPSMGKTSEIPSPVIARATPVAAATPTPVATVVAPAAAAAPASPAPVREPRAASKSHGINLFGWLPFHSKGFTAPEFKDFSRKEFNKLSPMQQHFVIERATQAAAAEGRHAPEQPVGRDFTDDELQELSPMQRDHVMRRAAFEKLEQARQDEISRRLEEVVKWAEQDEALDAEKASDEIVPMQEQFGQAMEKKAELAKLAAELEMQQNRLSLVDVLSNVQREQVRPVELFVNRATKVDVTELFAGSTSTSASKASKEAWSENAAQVRSIFAAVEALNAPDGRFTPVKLAHDDARVLAKMLFENGHDTPDTFLQLDEAPTKQTEITARRSFVQKFNNGEVLVRPARSGGGLYSIEEVAEKHREAESGEVLQKMNQVLDPETVDYIKTEVWVAEELYRDTHSIEPKVSQAPIILNAVVFDGAGIGL